MIDEGYIKYNSIWDRSPIICDEVKLQEFNEYRNKLIQLKMIGKIPDGPGFGNISVRLNDQSFLISATDTGHLAELASKDLAEVYKTDVGQNTVWCKGEKNASSESMTHSVIYHTKSDAEAIIHIHHEAMWDNYLDKLPTTNMEIEYGTPEMADEIRNLVKKEPEQNIFVLGGHKDGLICYGSSLSEAFGVVELAYKNMLIAK